MAKKPAATRAKAARKKPAKTQRSKRPVTSRRAVAPAGRRPTGAGVTAGLAPGMSWITPYLTVKDVGTALGWYEKALGFKKRATMVGPDGRMVHGEMHHESGVIMMGLENIGHDMKTPMTLGGTPITLYVYVKDVDTSFVQAQAAGAHVVCPPTDMYWGDRVATIVDPDGYRWSLATFKRKVSMEEMTRGMLAMMSQA